MVIERTTAFAMRCPACGRLEIQHLNIFRFAGDRAVRLTCECGSHKATINRSGTRYISIDYSCIICDREHRVVLPQKVFWSRNKLNNLVCLETDLQLGHFGPSHLIRTELQRQQDELNTMANELGFDDFADPEIMLETLDYLHDTAAAGGLYCECGSKDINIELLSDRLELTCNNCTSIMQIPASCKYDLDNLKSRGEIVVELAKSKPKNSRNHR